MSGLSKGNNSNMRNIFDQYSQPENRLTHALVCALAEDTKLLKHFVRWVTGKPALTANLQIVEQRLPGEMEVTEDESERRGLPDAWIHDNDNWSLLVESKVSAALSNDQLRRHRQTAYRRGFNDVTVLAIDVVIPTKKLLDGVIFKTWSEIYEWLSKQSATSNWAAKTLRYMEIAEARWTNDGYLKEGSLTKFAGIPFNNDNPYNYPEAKRLIRLMMDELRNRKDLQKQLNVDPIGIGRGMITGKALTAVWDFLRIKDFKHEKQFTKMLHLTVAIQTGRVVVIVTVPNGISSAYRKRLVNEGYDEFESMFKTIHKNMKKILSKVKGAESFVEVLQRHYRVQSAAPTKDAVMDFNLDTAFPSRRSKVKYQPLWLRAAYDLLEAKKGNTQLGVGAIFPYSSCLATQTPEILDHIAHVWVACKPLIQKILSDK